MDIGSIVDEALSIASEFGLRCKIVDVTGNTVNIRLHIDETFFIQLYANAVKSKLNLHLVFKGKRLYGADAEGGRYHIHPFEEPESHIFTEERENLRSFVIKSLEFLIKRGIL